MRIYSAELVNEEKLREYVSNRVTDVTLNTAPRSFNEKIQRLSDPVKTPQDSKEKSAIDLNEPQVFASLNASGWQRAKEIYDAIRKIAGQRRQANNESFLCCTGSDWRSRESCLCADEVDYRAR